MAGTYESRRAAIFRSGRGAVYLGRTVPHTRRTALQRRPFVQAPATASSGICTGPLEPGSLGGGKEPAKAMHLQEQAVRAIRAARATRGGESSTLRVRLSSRAHRSRPSPTVAAVEIRDGLLVGAWSRALMV